jgi:hypothetical protein
MQNICGILVGKYQGKKSLGILRCRPEHAIKMDLRETRSESVSWFEVNY